MEKHAYLIMAHKNDNNLKTLLSLLDDKRNDIYLHMDIKNMDYKFDDIKNIIKKSKICQIDRKNVSWGGYSQIEVELDLLKTSTSNNNYRYYHLISGQDMPIKSQDYIHDFFDNKNKEFLRFQEKKFKYYNRVRTYYPLQEKIGRKYKIITKIWGIISRPFVRRNRNINFQKGDNWFSITDDFARYVVSKEDWIYKVFKQTVCCDEIFMQTLLINSKFKNNLYYTKFDNNLHSIMRYIDWNRGNPYVFKNEDLDDLLKSDYLFARKFDSSIDDEIICNLKKRLCSKNEKNK